MMELVELVLRTLREEFADLPSAAETTRVIVRLMLAAALGGLLGFSRERDGKSAGLRTHMLVAMGSALFVMVPLLAGMAVADVSRVIQGVVAGIGFIGAGTIIKYHSMEKVQGLTTAAGIWTTSAIGVACGMGRSVTAIVSALLAWLVLSAVKQVIDPSPTD
jgi:putative Mg2+ transporter-C (MgtC) family protein